MEIDLMGAAKMLKVSRPTMYRRAREGFYGARRVSTPRGKAWVFQVEAIKDELAASVESCPHCHLVQTCWNDVCVECGKAMRP